MSLNVSLPIAGCRAGATWRMIRPSLCSSETKTVRRGKAETNFPAGAGGLTARKKLPALTANGGRSVSAVPAAGLPRSLVRHGGRLTEEGVQAARELRRLQPIGQPVDFSGGETDVGSAHK